MTTIQPLLGFIVLALLVVYFVRYRSKLRDRVASITLVTMTLVLIARPELANRLASLFGVGRGVDLLMYLSAPGLGFILLLVFARLRELEKKMTLLVREHALLTAKRMEPGSG